MQRFSLGMRKLDELSMFFPAYNEVENIPKLVKSAKKVCRETSKKYEIIIVVHQNSSDGTTELVKKLGEKDRKIKLVIQKKTDPGVGAAIRIGFNSAKYKNIFYADSDNQFNLEEFKKFVPFTDKHDIIAGYRIKRNDPEARIFTAKVYNAIVRTIFLVKQKDVDCAFRFVKRDIVKKIRLVCRHGLATTELLAKASRRGYSIKQIGVNHYPRTFGKPVFEIESGLNIPKPKVVWGLFVEMIKLFYDIYIVRDY